MCYSEKWLFRRTMFFFNILNWNNDLLEQRPFGTTTVWEKDGLNNDFQNKILRE